MTEQPVPGCGQKRSRVVYPFAALAAAFLSAVLSACGSSAGEADTSDAGDSEYAVFPDPPDGGDGGFLDADAQMSFDGGSMAADASESDGGDAGLPPAPPALSLTGVFPRRAPLSGSVPIELSGLGFFRSFSSSGASYAAAQTQIFIGGTEVKDFTIVNDYSIDAVAPASPEAGTFDVLVRNPSGESRCWGCFTYYLPLSLTAVTPSFGLASGGEWVEISGAGFEENSRVYFGDRESPSVELVSSERLRALTPEAAQPGIVQLEVLGTGGVSRLNSGFEYRPVPLLSGATPRVLPLAGGEVSLTGGGLSSAESVALDGELIDFTAVSDEELKLTVPGRSEPGSAELSASWPSGLSSTLPGGIFWSDETSQEGRPSILAVAPDRGPQAGGMTVTIIGAGLGSVSAAEFGNVRISAEQFISRSDTSIAVHLPGGIAGGAVDVAVLEGEAAASVLPEAFRYGPRITSVEPKTGRPGDAVRIIGEGFTEEECGWTIRFGLAEAPEASRISQTELTARIPEGRGLADLRIYPSCAPEAAALLTGAFSYESSLEVFAVSPGSGSVAGGEYVTVYGAGFEPGASFRIGSSLLKDVSVTDTSHASGRVPAGTAGAADVYAYLGDQSAELSGGYVYRAPPSAIGGSTGQAIAGSLSVITSVSSGSALPGVFVAVSIPGSGVIAQGITDSNGMLALQAEEMNRPVQVMFRKAGFRPLTVAGQASDTISVFLQQVQPAASGSEGTAVTSGGVLITGGTVEADVSQIPSNSTAAGGGTASPTFSVGSGLAVVSGTVSGFKVPRELGPDEIPMAKVSVAPSSYFSTAPFSSTASDAVRDAMGERWRVTSDGGPFTIYGRDGQQTVYAIFGIYNKMTDAFEPYLMGLARNVSSLPSSPAAGINIILDIHLTSHLPLAIEGADIGPDGQPMAEERRPFVDAYSWLSLGNSGYIPFGPGSGTDLSIGHLPDLSAENFLFLGRMVTQSSVTGFCFQRSEGALADGVSIGPMVAANSAFEPSDEGTSLVNDPDTGGSYRVYPFDGVLRWNLESGTPGDMQRLFVQIVHGSDGSAESAEAILPGSATSLDLGPLLDAPVDPGKDTVSVSYTSVRSPRFDYDFWSYSYFNTSALSCWTQGTFEPVLRKFVPPEEPPAESGE